MATSWSFLTNHARALLLIAERPDSRLREIAGLVGVTERTAHTIMTDLTNAGYVSKQRDGRRNIYHVQADLPVRDATGRQAAIGDLLDLFINRNGTET